MGFCTSICRRVLRNPVSCTMHSRCRTSFAACLERFTPVLLLAAVAGNAKGLGLIKV